MSEENTVIPSRGEYCLQVLPTQVNIRTYAIHTSSPVPAEVSANLNGCFTTRDLRVVDVGNGPFTFMPGYRMGGGYWDACLPSEGELRRQFRQAVLSAYERTLYQLSQCQQEYQVESTQSSEGM